jgi:hypothetical protein
MRKGFGARLVYSGSMTLFPFACMHPACTEAAFVLRYEIYP